MRFRRPGLIGVVWLVIGLVVASQRGYLDGIDTVKEFFSAILAIVLWPLLLLGINLNIR